MYILFFFLLDGSEAGDWPTGAASFKVSLAWLNRTLKLWTIFRVIKQWYAQKLHHFKGGKHAVQKRKLYFKHFSIIITIDIHYYLLGKWPYTLKKKKGRKKETWVALSWHLLGQSSKSSQKCDVSRMDVTDWTWSKETWEGLLHKNL